MIEQLKKHPALFPFVEALSNPSLTIEKLWDAPKALLALIAREHLKSNIVFITGQREEMRLLDDLSFFHSEAIYPFPSWETLPSDDITPSPDLVGRRFEILYNITDCTTPSILLCPLQALLQKLPSPKTLIPHCFFLRAGDEIPFETLPDKLTSLGYRRVPVAADKGEFAVRGGIIDIFPLSSPQPYRLDFFGDEIEQIRTYDPIGQITTGTIEQIFICPADELVLLREEKNLATLTDYFNKPTLFIFDDLFSLEEHYVALKETPGSQTRFFLTIEELFAKIKDQKTLFLTNHLEDFITENSKRPAITLDIFNQQLNSTLYSHPFQEITEVFSPFEEQTATNQAEILQGLQRNLTPQHNLSLVTANDAEEKQLRKLLDSHHITAPFIRGYLSSGFVLNHDVLLPYTELTKRYRVRRTKWRTSYHTPAAEFHQLSVGDLVVHFHNGVGKYLGTEKRANHLGQQTEYLVIEYAKQSKLFTPVSQSHLVSRYIGAKEETPTLSILGTPKWQRAKEQAQKSIIGYAQDLLKFNAEREVKGGYVYQTDSDEMLSFESSFPFTETEDQLLAIQDIKNDMCSKKAMDRLICGDVGYGKTEVAMRAAFKAVVDGGKQVAVLVPTTVLAYQHYESFKNRMSDHPITVAHISRFCKPKEIREALEKTARGEVDILIGTHRLISSDVLFKDLGLIIIDEEQRFGVRVKEKLKSFKIGVECLTLSATPIPRTLYLSLLGAKDVSVVHTPPQDRLPIKSLITERQDQTIKNALLRELSRDGQAYFIHNRVESINHVAADLQKLVPNARIVVGHGQMDAKSIDQVFQAFKSGEADILVATTIVENGLDIPNANTILIDRSHHYGLADLYQLRGRVGRWNRPAFAYFLIPTRRSLPELTYKRLEALAETSGFGGGMKIAMRDLEIRGAGDILGTKQSGHISSIGFHLYCKLLKRAIDALHKNLPFNFSETKMEFPYDATLPDSYISESSIRLEIYHRLGEAIALSDVDKIYLELQDRFGKPPPQTTWLHHLTRIRIFANQKHYTELKFSKRTLTAIRESGKQKILALPKITDPATLEKHLFENL